METAPKTTKHEISLDDYDLSKLSQRARDYVRRRPKEARLLASYVMEARELTKTGTVLCESRGKRVRVPKRLAPYLSRMEHGPGMIGSAEASVRLGVTREKVRAWVRGGKMIGWKHPLLGFTLPQEQILQPSVMVMGVRETLEIIGDPGLAWTFLETEWPFEHDVARPIDKLRSGKALEVWFAARGFGAGSK